MRARRKKYGQSTLEFVALVMFILATFIVFQKYIVRGFSGRWKSVGDTFGQGSIFDPNSTIECAANTFFQDVPAVWYNQTCFEENCEPACLLATKDEGDCSTCLATCRSVYCDD